jgi:ParB-like chromosome segregation protein Spo0J
MVESRELQLIRLEQLHAHPLNSNRMSQAQLSKLKTHIESTERYPLIVRPHPDVDGHFQVLDGHQRLRALGELHVTDAFCVVWQATDDEALVLLATLNRLRGSEQAAVRAELLAEITSRTNRLRLPLPESRLRIAKLLVQHGLTVEEGAEACVDPTAFSRSTAVSRPLTFVLSTEEADLVERALGLASIHITGPGRRGRALAAIARRFLEGGGLD